jgi:hypothetical protein
LDNKEETTYRRDKERKEWEKYKRVNGYLKNTLNQKDNINSLQCLPVLCSPCKEGITTESKPSNGQGRIVKVAREKYLCHPQILTPEHA